MGRIGCSKDTVLISGKVFSFIYELHRHQRSTSLLKGGLSLNPKPQTPSPKP